MKIALNLQKKILSGYLIIVLLIIAIGVVVSYNFSSLGKRVQYLTSDVADDVAMADKIATEVLSLRIAVEKFIALNRDTDLAKAENQIKSLNALLAEAKKTVRMRERSEKLALIEQKVAAYIDNFQKVTIRMEAQKENKKNLYATGQKIEDELSALVAAAMDESGKNAEAASRAKAGVSGLKSFVSAKADITMFLQDYDAAFSKNAIEKLDATIRDLSPGKVFENVISKIEEYSEDFSGLASISLKMNAEVEKTLYPLAPEIVQLSVEVMNSGWQEMRQASVGVDTTSKQVLRGSYAVYAVAILLAIAIGLIVARIITVPLSRLVAITRRIAQGDYDQSIAVASRDELGDLTENFNNMIKEIAESHASLGRKVEELRSRNILLSTQQEASIDGILAVDESSRIVSCNNRFVSMWGIPAELVESGSDDLARQYMIDNINEPSRFLEKIKYLHEHRAEISHDEIILRDGRIFDCYTSPMFGADGVYYGRLWLFRDITEHKQAEEEKKKSIEQIMRFQAAILQLAEATYADFDTDLRRITEVAARTLQVERVGVWLYSKDHSEILCNDLYSLAENSHERGAKLLAREYARYFESIITDRIVAVDDAGIDPRTSEFSEGYLKPLGIVSMMDVSIRLYGKIAGVLCHETIGDERHWTIQEQDFAIAIANMISLALEAAERKRAEELYRILAEKSLVSVCIIQKSKFAYVNAQIIAYSGYSADELYTLDPAILLHPDDRRMIKNCATETLKGKRSTPYVYRLLTRAGDIRWIMETVAHIVYEGKGAVLCYSVDISERKKLESQLVQAQKMEAVGTLAGGIAHDFNNMMGGITGSLSLIKYKLLQNGEIKKEELEHFLNIMDEAGMRATAMVQQLLSFSRKEELSLAPVDLNMTIKNVINICRNSLDKCINLAPLYLHESAMVNGDPTQLVQLLLNLCINAGHAMTIMRGKDELHGGTLSVELHRMQADRHFCMIHPEAAEGEYWRLSVRDTGIGMDEITKSKIFNPFFTMKEQGMGTGLGLAMVYTIAKQHNGFIDVYSEVGQGTTFTIYLPVFHGPADDGAILVEEALPKGTGLILVADDEEVIRKTARSILEECGYEVITANDGEEGVAVFRQRHAEIKAVLLDLVMPRMSGREAFIEMKKIDSNLKVLLISGFKQGERVDSLLSLGIKGFMQKPFSLKTLSAAVDKIIHAAPS